MTQRILELEEKLTASHSNCSQQVDEIASTTNQNQLDIYQREIRELVARITELQTELQVFLLLCSLV